MDARLRDLWNKPLTFWQSAALYAGIILLLQISKTALRGASFDPFPGTSLRLEHDMFQVEAERGRRGPKTALQASSGTSARTKRRPKGRIRGLPSPVGTW
jgi:hypothetical protein